MAPRATPGAAAVSTDPLASPFVALGQTGLRQFGGYIREEWLRDLQGWRGVRVLREMRDNDPIVGGIFFAIENLLRGVAFRIEPEDKTSTDDIAAAEFVNSCISDMEQTWPELIAEILTFLQYGWAVHETLYKRRKGRTTNRKTSSKYDDGLIGWRRFSGRAQETLLRWEFDDDGDPVAMVQMPPTGGGMLTVPLAKCLHFKTSAIKGNPEGRTILRNAYVPWYRKKRIEEIEAIGIERDLAGLPIAWVPAKYLSAGASPEDKATLDMFKRMVRDTVRNEQEGFVLPLAYDKDGNKQFDFTLLNSDGKRAFDTTSIVNRYDQRIAMSMLADFILIGHEKVGSYSMAGSKTDLFRVAVTAYLDTITAEFNDNAIPDVLVLNGMPGKARMLHGDISDADLKGLAEYVSKMAGAGIIVPDDALEAHIREEGGLPASEAIGQRDIGDGGGEADSGTVTPDKAPPDTPDQAQQRPGAAPESQ